MTQQNTKTQDAKKIAEFLGVPEKNFWQRRRTIIVIAIAAVLILLLGIIFGGGPGKIQYATESVQKSNLVITVIATGNLQPTNQVEVGSEISGLVTEVLVDNNDVVERGQVLAKVEDREIVEQVRAAEASQEVAKATIRQREADLKFAKLNFDRSKNLFERQLLAKQALDDAESRHLAALAQLDLSSLRNVVRMLLTLGNDDTLASKEAEIHKV